MTNVHWSIQQQHKFYAKLCRHNNIEIRDISTYKPNTSATDRTIHLRFNNTDNAQTVWKQFDCRILRDYHDIYNKSDFPLLADVFENFRDVCMTNYKLDPAWYFTSPGLAWDAALKLTKL